MNPSPSNKATDYTMVASKETSPLCTPTASDVEAQQSSTIRHRNRPWVAGGVCVSITMAIILVAALSGSGAVNKGFDTLLVSAAEAAHDTRPLAWQCFG
jgi:hypothetical protein